VHLGERECSIQRRHQKVIEESPSPAVGEALRARMGEAAIAVARAVGYVGAGTVEFVLDGARNFYFLEMNTRLQVEHPVTELVTGVDLVQAQLRVAAGEPIGDDARSPVARGHAVECRLCAEDPEREYAPSAGRLVDFHVPELPGVRVDTGFARGDIVPVYYDPLLAKIIAHGVDRTEATRRLAQALRGTSVAGVATNRALLLRVLEHPDWLAGRLDTAFLVRHREALAEAAPEQRTRREVAAMSVLAARVAARRREAVLPYVAPRYRNNPFRDAEERLIVDGEELLLRYRAQGAHFEVHISDGPMRVVRTALAPPRDGEVVAGSVDLDGHVRPVRVGRDGDAWFVHGPLGTTRVEAADVDGAVAARVGPGADRVRDGACRSPVPGTVVRVLVAAGEVVAAGASLVVLDAMKMEHVVTAPHEGTVRAVHVEVGVAVQGGAPLVDLAGVGVEQ
jgi:acetyl/propionyl-CoA carboxylase alpha subunit